MVKFRLLFFSLLTITLTSTLVFPQTSGKISGKIMDKQTGKAIPFANIFVNGTTKGAAADDEGNYTILDVAPGTYSVTASVVGYQKVTVENVTVNVDFTTRLNFQLSAGTINLSAVVITGERNPLVRQDLTNPTVAITQATIQELPVDEISQVIALQAGVVQGNDGQLHVRGGYGNEIAYTLNGVSVNDPFGNHSAIGMATNAVQEVSVSTGTFSAEYGGALSGVVNYITKEGGSNYSFSLRGYTGDNWTNRSALYSRNILNVDPLNDSRMEGTLGGPMPFDNDIRFFLSGVYVNSKGYLYGQRLYNPTDSYLTPDSFNSSDSLRTSGGKYTKSTDPYFFNPYSSNTNGKPTGDGKYISMNPSSSYNFQGNISYRISPQIKLKYEAVYSQGQDKPTSLDEAGSSTNFVLDYKYNPDGVGTEYSNGLVQTLGLTHTVSDKMFYTLKASYSKNQYQYYLYKNATDPRYLPDLYQLPISNTVFLAGGTDNYRENRTTTTLGIKGDIDAQLFSSHEFKAGFEYRMYHLTYEDYYVQIGIPQANGSLGAITNQGLLYDSLNIVREVPYGNPALYSNFNQKPSQFAAYIQDKIELASTLILNLGLRYELFNPDASYNPNISQNLIDSLAGYITAYNIRSTIKQTLAPRISVSYPITDRGIIRFSYGHFYQNGSLSSLYNNNQYYVVNFGSTPTFGNPNVLPQKSVQYEIGLQQALTDNFKFDLTGFYKDVTNYIYTESIYTTTGRQYNVLTNLAYSNVRGVTLSFLKRSSPGDIFSASLDYTFSIAEGNRTQPSSEMFFSEQSGQRSEMYLVPLSFDRSHVINGTVALNQPNDWSLGLIFNFQTGTPYTPSLPASFTNVTYTQNSGNQLTQWNVDLKFEKYFKIGNINYSLFLQVMNLFDTQNELSVYQSSGRALSAVEQTTNYSQFSDIVRRINNGDPGLFGIQQINNYYSQRPENVSTPREVRLGFSVLFN